MSTRKADHIKLAFEAQTEVSQLDDRFYYEPLLNAHPSDIPKTNILGKVMKAPIWISSMTGGTELAGTINKNLAQACQEFGLGMGLGSCRILLDSDEYFEDFNLRPIIGPDQPFYANLGIAQVETLLREGQTHKIQNLLDKLQADGLIVHINPLQEYFQPEGDVIYTPPIETIKNLLIALPNINVIVKEVGQGLGPKSLEALLELKIQAIDFGAFGGTNFSLLEMLRNEETAENLKAFANIGNTAHDMVSYVNAISTQFENKGVDLIISGGIKNFLDGYYLTQKCQVPSIYGQGSALLRHARGSYVSLQKYIADQLEGLKLSYAYLNVK